MIIEVLIKEYLDDTLDTPVFYNFPEDAPDEFVLVDKIGSGESNYLGSSSFAFQSYSSNKYGAILLNAEVKQAVKDAIELAEISRVELNSDYNFPDTTRKRPRYQAVFDINHY